VVRPALALHLPVAVSAQVESFVSGLTGEPGIRMVAVTGSAVDGGWIPGWSDLDLLVIAEPGSHSTVEHDCWDLGRVLAKSVGTKVGLTLLTPGEVAARLLQPRVMFALHRIASGVSPVLSADETLRLPAISDAEVTAAIESDLPQVVVTLRRLQAAAGTDEFDLRAVYKHVVLTCRLLLRLEGIDATGCDRILAVAEAGLPGLGALRLPGLADVAAGRSNRRVHNAVDRAADQVLAWYSQQIDA
jgi:predicted nucleotidyltransferase